MIMRKFLLSVFSLCLLCSVVGCGPNKGTTEVGADPNGGMSKAEQEAYEKSTTAGH